MGALYEDVENFFGDIFAWYGRRVARRPLPFVVVPLLVCSLLGLGLFNIHYEADLETLYTPVNSRAMKDRSTLRRLFGPYSTPDQFYPHQVVDRPTYVEVIVTAKTSSAEINNPPDDDDDDADRERGGNETKTKLTSDNQTRHVDVLSPPYIDEIRRLYYHIINNVTTPSSLSSSPLDHKGYPGTLSYRDVCPRRASRCVVSGQDLLLTETAEETETELPRLGLPDCVRRTDRARIRDSAAAGISFERTSGTTEDPPDHGCLPALAVKLRFHLNGRDATARQKSLHWQDAFIDAMLLYRSDVIDVAFVAADSLQDALRVLLVCLSVTSWSLPDPITSKRETKIDVNVFQPGWSRRALDELARRTSRLIEHTSSFHEAALTGLANSSLESRDHIGDDTRLITVSIVAMLVLATITGWSCRPGCACAHGGHVPLAYMGVVAALLAILGAFGFLSLIGSRFVNLCSVMPFLVLGIGADDMFQLMIEWRATNPRDETEVRMANTLRSAAVSITITSLTELLAFCIGATSPFLGVRNFCACSGVGVFLCYVNQLTFFCGCIILHSRLVTSTCRRSSSSLELGGITGPSSPSSDTPARYRRKSVAATRSMVEALTVFIQQTYPLALLQWLGKLVVVVLFVLYIVLSSWGVSRLRESFQLESVIPAESYYTKHLRLDKEYFWSTGLTMMLAIDKPLPYHKKVVQRQIISFLDRVVASPSFVNATKISWMKTYLEYWNKKLNETGEIPRDKEAWLRPLIDGSFFAEQPQYRNDVLLSSANHGSVSASRFYVIGRRADTEASAEEGLMLGVRELATGSEPSVIPYCPEFIYYERYLSVKKDTLLPVGVTIIGMLFVALVFIPHPIPVACVTVSMVSVVVGITGLMQFWGVTLSAITTIQIIIGVGICVSFTVSMSHAFMTATGRNRNDRVAAALEKVALPILNGAAASLLSTLVMCLGNSYVFVSFYKTMILVFVLGVLHSVVFLPVLLSFVGPRRTNRPRGATTAQGGGAPEAASVPRRCSVRGVNCVVATPAQIDPPQSPGLGSGTVELRTLPGEAEASHRTSLFAGERDSLSGYEGRPVVRVDRHAAAGNNNETHSNHGQCKQRPVDRIEES